MCVANIVIPPVINFVCKFKEAFLISARQGSSILGLLHYNNVAKMRKGGFQQPVSKWLVFRGESLGVFLFVCTICNGERETATQSALYHPPYPRGAVPSLAHTNAAIYIAADAESMQI